MLLGVAPLVIDWSVSVAGRLKKLWHNCANHPPVAEIHCFGTFHVTLSATLMLT